MDVLRLPNQLNAKIIRYLSYLNIIIIILIFVLFTSTLEDDFRIDIGIE